MNFHHFSVKSKLSLAFGLLAGLVLLVSVMAISALKDTNQNFDHYSLVNVAQAQLVTDVRGAVNRRAIAARNLVLASTPEEMAAEKQAVTQAHNDIQQYLATLNARLQDAGTNPEERRLASEINRVEGLYGPVALRIVQLALDGKKELATTSINKECKPLLAALLQASNDYQQFSNRLGKQSVDSAGTDYARARGLLIAASLFALAAAIVLGLLITRGLVRALGGEPQAAADVARAVAQGDLTRPIAVRPGDETSLMAQLQRMQNSLQDVVANVRQSAEGVSTASAEIAQGNQDLSGRTEQQASALQETAASMEQLSGTVQHNADAAHKANQLAETASAVAVQGGTVVTQVVDTMQAIHGSSQKIADIIGVIDGIAFQTNILALNAAVEAARAGEHGRGFAVVASEVRGLAQRSAGAAKEIKTLIDHSVRQVAQGSALVATAGTTMTDVVTAIGRVTDIISEVSAASREQSQGVAQVGQAITQMDQVTQQNAALVEESSAAAGSLSSQAAQLLQAVSVFQLGGNAGEARPVPAAAPLSTPLRMRGPAPQQAGMSRLAAANPPAWR